MRRVLSPGGGAIAFVLVSLLVIGGLAWVTVESLRVEEQQRLASARADAAQQERLALWRLDSRLFPIWGVENHRPFSHYFPFTTLPLWKTSLTTEPLQVPSPLITAELPDWMTLHFQLDPDTGWESPQVHSNRGRQLPMDQLLLFQQQVQIGLSERRQHALAFLEKDFPAPAIHAQLLRLEVDLEDSPLAVPYQGPMPAVQALPRPGAPQAASVRLGMLISDDPFDDASLPHPPPTQAPQAPLQQLLNLRAVLSTTRGSHAAAATTQTSDLFTLKSGMATQDEKRQEGPTQKQLESQNRVVPIPQPASATRGRGDFDRRADVGKTSMKDVMNIGEPALTPALPAMARPDASSAAADAAPNAAASASPPSPGSAPPTAANAVSPAGTPSPPTTSHPIPVPPAAADALASAKTPTTSHPIPVPPTAAAGSTVERASENSRSARQGPLPPPPLGPANVQQTEGTPPATRKTEATPPAMQKTEDAPPPPPLGPANVQQTEAPLPATHKTEASPPAMQKTEDAPPASLPPAAAGVELETAAEKSLRAVQQQSRFFGADLRVGSRGVEESSRWDRAASVQLGPMRPVWLTAPNGSRALILVRAAKQESKTVFQGVLLDWPRLQALLLDEVRGQFPQGRLEPLQEGAPPSERCMAALPAVFDPGQEPPLPPAGWTPLRVGLLLGWIAALLALAAVAFVGWTLIDLSERRIRFVSAVTHELRTPLTSLRLYTDLLASGMIQEEHQQRQYLRTLGHESERLHTLIENVLDFARLEKRHVQAQRMPVLIADLLEQVRQAWQDRLAHEGRELVIESLLPPNQVITTDARIAAQILGNLIDNARKYTREAVDPRIWVRLSQAAPGRVVMEVEDRGPGVPPEERASIFRPFRRGKNACATGGAGLGLALARQWAELLGGSIRYVPPPQGVGACFRVELPG